MLCRPQTLELYAMWAALLGVAPCTDSLGSPGPHHCTGSPAPSCCMSKTGGPVPQWQCEQHSLPPGHMDSMEKPALLFLCGHLRFTTCTVCSWLHPTPGAGEGSRSWRREGDIRDSGHHNNRNQTEARGPCVNPWCARCSPQATVEQPWPRS